MGLSAEKRAMVTEHAMVRFLERVDGYDLTEIGEELAASGIEATDYNILNKLGEKYGLTRGHIAYKIMTKDVYLAVKAGATRVKRGEFVLEIQDGAVTTIKPRVSSVARSERKKRTKGGKKPVSDRASLKWTGRGSKRKVEKWK